MRTLVRWEVAGPCPAGVALRVEGRHALRLEVLEPALFRVRLLRDGAWRCDRSWSVAPGGDAPPEGRARDRLDGFACPPFTLSEDPDGLTLSTDRLRVHVRRPLHLVWEACTDAGWQPLVSERPTGAWEIGRRTPAIGHYLLRGPGERVYGLGDKAGPLERGGRSFDLRNLDAMGYDAATTDPLYKHIPFTLTRTAAAGAFGLFYDTLATCRFDIGREIDNYHAPYRSFRAEDGDLDIYLSWAPTPAPLVAAQQALTGGMAFPPRWSLGYSGSTMAHTDAPDAQARLEGFLDRLAEHDIPCDSFHLSSGYTSIGPRRYVFHWNRDKVPDPEGLCARFNAAGVPLVANVKPCLLTDHPRYAEAAQAGLFIPDSETGEPALAPFWDGQGAHLDFTNPATQAWWAENIREALLDKGVAAIWNDNNEYPVWDHDAPCHGFGREVALGLVRPAQAVLMTRASETALRAAAPGRRPYLVIRSGCAGLQRHAQTWSGDNRTGWDTLRWNIRQGLSLALSGISNIGHDVGGFAGPQPGPELLLRWVQNGIFHPRFSIHSWNPDGTATEPWTHPQVLAPIRDAIRLRVRLMPYLYTCLWQAVTRGAPMIRPTFLDHDHDAACFEDCDEFLLGRDLLVASVVEEGARERRLWLPDNGTGWWDFHTGVRHAPGQWLTQPVGLRDIPLFVRAGAAVPMEEGGARVLTVWPAPQGASVSEVYDDAGDNADALAGNHCLIRAEVVADAGAVSVSLSRSGALPPPWPSLRLRLPKGEGRVLRVPGARDAGDGTLAVDAAAIPATG